MTNFIDVHCHLTDERIASNLDKEISEAKAVGVTHFISVVLCQEEFKMMKLPKFQKLKEFAHWTAGIHPHYEKTDEKDFEKLIQLCDEKAIIAVGEMGLDSRNDDFNWQKKMLLKQLDLAVNYNLPVVFHCVRKYYELHKILKNNFPKVRGFMHAFNASMEIFTEFSKYDLAFSMNAIPPKDDVIRAVIKRGFYLFETDAPAMRPRELKEEFNHLKNLIWAVDRISEISQIEKQELATTEWKSFEQIFGKIF
jgi:TatD DNase family protein